MTVYSKLGATQTVSTDAALTLDASDITTSISGANTIVFVKLTNASTTVPVNVSFQTSGVLSADADPVILAPGATDFVQVAALRNTGPVYFYFSAASSVDVYVTPVAIVGA